MQHRFWPSMHQCCTTSLFSITQGKSFWFQHCSIDQVSIKWSTSNYPKKPRINQNHLCQKHGAVRHKTQNDLEKLTSKLQKQTPLRPWLHLKQNSPKVIFGTPAVPWCPMWIHQHIYDQWWNQWLSMQGACRMTLMIGTTKSNNSELFMDMRCERNVWYMEKRNETKVMAVSFWAASVQAKC